MEHGTFFQCMHSKDIMTKCLYCFQQLVSQVSNYYDSRDLFALSFQVNQLYVLMQGIRFAKLNENEDV